MLPGLLYFVFLWTYYHPYWEDPRINIDYISFPRESVRSMSDRYRSGGLYYLGSTFGINVNHLTTFILPNWVHRINAHRQEYKVKLWELD